MKKFIKKYDLDKSKTIDVQELMVALEGKGISREAVTDFVERYDLNDDRELDKKELYLFFKEHGI